MALRVSSGEREKKKKEKVETAPLLCTFRMWRRSFVRCLILVSCSMFTEQGEEFIESRFGMFIYGRVIGSIVSNCFGRFRTYVSSATTKGVVNVLSLGCDDVQGPTLVYLCARTNADNTSRERLGRPDGARYTTEHISLDSFAIPRMSATPSLSIIILLSIAFDKGYFSFSSY